MFTITALWTQAREKLDITTVILSNRKYAILMGELANVGAKAGPLALDLFSLSNPDLNWISIANGFGVEASRATTMEEFALTFERANAQSGPHLIELVI